MISLPGLRVLAGHIQRRAQHLAAGGGDNGVCLRMYGAAQLIPLPGGNIHSLPGAVAQIHAVFPTDDTFGLDVNLNLKNADTDFVIALKGGLSKIDSNANKEGISLVNCNIINGLCYKCQKKRIYSVHNRRKRQPF